MSTFRELQFGAAAVLGAGFLRGLGASLRVERFGTESFQKHRREGRPVVFVFWHSRLLPLAYIHRDEGAVVLVSRHADGEYIARIVDRLGFGTARGSSSRGGAAGFRQLVRAARSGRDLALTPDGPRGPACTFKTGALVVAQRTGLPLIPVGVRVEGAWTLSSWDRFVIPHPFARVEVHYGPGHWVPKELNEVDLQAKAEELAEVLNGLTFPAATPS